MAEILGVVASGIAVGQLAAELLKGVKALHTFVKDTKDAPSNLQDAAEDLETMAETLSMLESTMSSSASAPVSLFQKCRTRCVKASAEVNAVVVGLQKGLIGESKLRRKWSSVQAALKKGDLENFQRKLESAKSMMNTVISNLIFIQNENHRQLLETQHQMNIQSFQEILTLVSSSSDTSLTMQTPTANDRNKLAVQGPNLLSKQQGRELVRKVQTTKWIGIGYFINTSQTFRTQTNYNDEIIDSTRSWRFIPASWFANFSSMGGEFLQAQRGGSWKYQLNPIRVLPTLSPIFLKVWSGDLEGVKYLISQGLASVNDTTPNGLSLLHIAAFRHFAEILDFLIREGADANVVDLFGYTPLHLSAWDWLQFSDFKDFWKLGEQGRFMGAGTSSQLELTRVLIEQGECDPVPVGWRGISIFDMQWNGEHHGAIDAWRYLMYQQDVFLIDLPSSGIGWNIFATSASSGAPEKHHVKVLLGDTLHMYLEVRLEVIYSEPYHIEAGTMLSWSAWNLFNDFTRGQSLNKELDWTRQLVRTGADIWASHSYGRIRFSIFDIFLQFQCGPRELCREELLFEWLLMLHLAGRSLAEYLRGEEEHHDDGKAVEFYIYRPDYERKFRVDYNIDEESDITLYVWDEPLSKAINTVPGAWDEATEYIETNHLIHFRGDDQPVAWSVSTHGFSRGDYTMATAGYRKDWHSMHCKPSKKENPTLPDEWWRLHQHFEGCEQSCKADKACACQCKHSKVA